MTEADEIRKSEHISEKEIIRHLEEFLKQNFDSLIKEEQATEKIGKELESKFIFIRNMIILLLEYKKGDKDWDQKSFFN